MPGDPKDALPEPSAPAHVGRIEECGEWDEPQAGNLARALPKKGSRETARDASSLVRGQKGGRKSDAMDTGTIGAAHSADNFTYVNRLHKRPVMLHGHDIGGRHAS